MSQREKVRKKQPHYPVEVKEMAVGRLQAGEKAATIVAKVSSGVGSGTEVVSHHLGSGASSGRQRWGGWLGSCRRSWIF
jgi:hypothetical protein